MRFIFAFVIYILVSIPFLNEYFSISRYTQLRPAAALPTSFGLLFGLPGALGCAFANLVCDVFISGYDFNVYFWGFWSMLLFGAIPILLWKITRSGEVRLNSGKRFFNYFWIVIFTGVFNASMTGLTLKMLNQVNFFSSTVMIMLFNNCVMGFIIGIPTILLVTLIRTKKTHTPRSLNERFVWGYLIIGIMSAVLVGVTVILELYFPNPEINKLGKIYFYSGIDLVIILVITIIGLFETEKSITKPLAKLIELSKEFTASDKGAKACRSISKKCEALHDTRTEVGILAATIGDMVGNIDKSIEEITKINTEKEHMSRELAIATNIQKNMLPTIFPPFPNRKDIDLFATMIPAKEVGGDFYDFYFSDENTLSFLIADVSGKGIPAAMFMMTTKTMIKNFAETGVTLDEVFNQANHKLCEINDSNMFVTAWMGAVDMTTGVLSFVNAGHNPPLIKRANGKFEYLKERSGIVLAGMDGIKYRKKEVQLYPGDKIYLYTDGVTEAEDIDNNLFGEERLQNYLNSLEKIDVVESCDGVMREIEKFVGDAPQFDDITMLMFSLNEINSLSRISLIPSKESIKRITDFAENWMTKTHVEARIIKKVNIIIDEIYSNIANYSKAGWASFEYYRDVENIYISFKDNGIEYNPLNAPDPDITLSADERQIGGLGIMMVKKMASNIDYQFENGENSLKITIKVN